MRNRPARMRRLVLAVAVASTLLGGVASARSVSASGDPSRIVIGAAIGGIRLGMTQEAVVAAYGAPRKRTSFTFPSGKPGVATRYVRHGAALDVTYSGGRVVWVETGSPYYRTASGVGVGAPIAAAGRLAGFEPDLCDGGFTRAARGILTTFVPRGRTIARVRIVRRSFFDC